VSRYAEKANYWDTTVHPAKSQGEIIEILEDFGADSIQMTQGQAGGRYAWLIRFQWQGKSYRFAFTPLECLNPDWARSFGGKKRTFAEQSRYQMGRIAVYFVRAILTAAEAQPGALFGFLELPASAGRTGAVPPVASEVDISKLISSGSLMPDIPQLVEGEIVEE
jgi:hypothetical protein